MFRSNLPILLIALYTRRYDLKLFTNSEAVTGITTAMFIPSLRLLIDFEAEGTVLQNEHDIKRHICASQHYHYVELPASYDPDQTVNRIRMLFRQRGIPVTSDPQADLQCVKQQFRLLHEKLRCAG